LAIASPTPGAWPNLDRVKNPKGIYCDLDGLPGGDPERAAQNRLRNRYHLPETGFEQLNLTALENKLPQGEIGPDRTLINYPASEDPNNQRAVTVVGYVTDVLILGCGAAHSILDDGPIVLVEPKQRVGVESANCYVHSDYLCTAQLMVTPDPDLPHSDGHNIFWVDVTRRSRWLAKSNHLTSNIGNNWSTPMLRKQIKGHWLRLSGWLFFNQNYRERAWVSDPENKIGKKNERQTAWEIHPVMGIEVLDHRPQ
jgi:hypothetical protein